MVGLRKQSSTAHGLPFLLVLTSDHITGATGITPTVTISKNDGTFATPAGAVTEIANGWYQVTGNATDTATLGPLLLHATGTGCDPTDESFQVVGFDPDSATNLGLSAMPTANAGANGGLPTVDSNNNVHGLQTRTVSDTSVIGTSTLTGTAQSGDSFAIVNNGTYGNAALLSVLGTIAGMFSGIAGMFSGIAASVWGYTTRILTAGTNIVLAKGAGLTGLNDIAAGTQMDLVNAPNAAAVTAIQAGLNTAISTQEAFNGNGTLSLYPVPGPITVTFFHNGTTLATATGSLPNNGNPAVLTGSGYSLAIGLDKSVTVTTLPATTTFFTVGYSYQFGDPQTVLGGVALQTVKIGTDASVPPLLSGLTNVLILNQSTVLGSPSPTTTQMAISTHTNFDQYTDSVAVFINEGLARRVTGYDLESNVITVSPPLPSAVGVGDVINFVPQPSTLSSSGGNLSEIFGEDGVTITYTPPSSSSSTDNTTSVRLGPVSLAASSGGANQAISVFENTIVVLKYSVTDNGAPYELMGHTLKFSIHDEQGNVIQSFDSQTDSSQFSLGQSTAGATAGVHDIVNTMLLPANLVTPGTFLYKMWDQTANIVLATGQLGVILAV